MKKYKKIFPWFLILAAVLFMEAYYIGENHSMGEVTLIPQANLTDIRMAGNTLTQQFTCKNERMEGIILEMNVDSAGDVGEVFVDVRRNRETIAQWSFNRFSVKNNMIKLMFEEPVENAVGETFEIQLKCDADSGVLLNVGTTKGAGAERLLYGEEEYDNMSLCYGIVIHNISAKTVFMFVAFFTIAVFGILFLVLKKENIQIETVFAICYILLGIFLLIAIPVFKTPDEINHFLRSYEISEGHLLSKSNPDGVSEGIDGAGRELPRDLQKAESYSPISLRMDEIGKMMDIRIDEEERAFIGFGNTALYAPGTYLPQSLGIFITRLFTKRLILIAYGARFFNWAITGILLFLSLRFLPVGKKPAFLIMMIPMNVQQYNSMSPDAFTFALCMALTAFVLDQRMRRTEKMKKRHYLEMYVMVLLLCQCKVVYLPMCLLLFLIPWERFGSKKVYFLNICGVAVLGAVTFLGWMGLSAAFLTEFRPGVETGEQIAYILHQPLEYVRVLIRTLNERGDYWIRSAKGEYLGWLTIETSFAMLGIYSILTWIYVLFDNDIREKGLEKFVRLMLFATVGIIALLVCTSLYLQWTPLQLETIEGVQGRYFLPILFPAMLAMKPKPELINNKGLNGKYMYISALGINLVIFSILITYAV